MKNLLIGGAILVGLSVAVYYFFFQKEEATKEEDIKVQVQQGDFEVYVIATGELKAKHSEKILGPEGMRTARIYSTTISNIVPEGTIVQAGDFVASLDRSELDGKIKDKSAEIEKGEAQLTQIKIDTAIEMRALRNQLVNLRYNMKEKELELEQSKYEPPAVLRRVQLDLDRINRDYDQQQTNYKLKQQQSIAKVQEVISSLQKTQSQFAQLMQLSGEFNITAPKQGMVIYRRTYDGKQGPGSRINPWNPVVAELPDLTSMISKTYVNEVDINKVRVNQEVVIQADAFPDKSFDGKVVEIANVGEQMGKFDAKVFEVLIELNETDTILRPAMTTSNQIITKKYVDVLFIPLEALHSNDTLTYVFKETENGEIVKQEVITGAVNDNSVIVKYGLKKGTTISLSVPENEVDIKIERLTKEEMAVYKQEQKDEQLKIQKQALKAAEIQQQEAEKRKALIKN